MIRLIKQLALALVLGSSTHALGADFPKRPIKLMVYTKPGGAIDVFARKYVQIAEKYHKGKIVVVNKPGAGGMIAMKKLSRAKADGYNIAAITKSVVGKMATTSSPLKLNDFTWLGQMVSDPEAIIVNRKGRIGNWKAVVKDAQSRPGKQLWVGPSPGGNDHILALKLWQALGIRAKWIPYSGGGKAMVALLGKHGDVYVGNPGDVLGKPDLKVVAVASPIRLSGQWKDAPTFKELGVKGFDQEIMWRGFVAPKGLKADAKKFHEDLLREVSNDVDWKAFISKMGGRPTLVGDADFKALAAKDFDEFVTVGKAQGLIK